MISVNAVLDEMIGLISRYWNSLMDGCDWYRYISAIKLTVQMVLVNTSLLIFSLNNIIVSICFDWSPISRIDYSSFFRFQAIKTFLHNINSRKQSQYKCYTFCTSPVPSRTMSGASFRSQSTIKFHCNLCE